MSKPAAAYIARASVADCEKTGAIENVLPPARARGPVGPSTQVADRDRTSRGTIRRSDMRIRTRLRDGLAPVWDGDQKGRQAGRELCRFRERCVNARSPAFLPLCAA